MKSFASDNYAPVHPRILEALSAANVAHARAYGDDPWTARARQAFRREFGDSVETHFVFNGTAANVLSLRALTQSFDAIVCSDVAHIATDECGAPEFMLGTKLLTLPSRHGKLDPAQVAGVGREFSSPHQVRPRVLSLSQSTEMGTVYTVEELRELCRVAHERGWHVHMDGARIANAAVALGRELREITRDVGVDVLSFGGAKNGLMFGEAVVFMRPELAENFPYLRKQSLQLASKMRFISAQFEVLLDEGLWRANAERANRAAQKLRAVVEAIPGVELVAPADANALFVRVPKPWIEPLQAAQPFYVWSEARSELRWMCSFDTGEAEINAFAELLRELAAKDRG